MKHFLEYAEQQVLINISNNHKENSDYIISEQIADALKAHGHIVNTNVGRQISRLMWPLQMLSIMKLCYGYST